MDQLIIDKLMNDTKVGEAFIRRGSTVAKFIDQYGEERIIYRKKGMRDLSIKNNTSTRLLTMNRVISRIIGINVNKFRTKNSMSMSQLGKLLGMNASPKQRVYEIEKSNRKQGVRLGTLFLLAEALNVDITDILPSMDDIKLIMNEIGDDNEKV